MCARLPGSHQSAGMGSAHLVVSTARHHRSPFGLTVRTSGRRRGVPVPTLPMPDRPHLDSFRRQARALQRAVRAGDPDAVRAAHRSPRRSTARRPSGLPAQCGAAGRRPRVRVRQLAPADAIRGHRGRARLGHRARFGAHRPTRRDEFCRLACLTYSHEDGPARWAQARQLLAERPDLTAGDIWAAATAARPDDVAPAARRAAAAGGRARSARCGGGRCSTSPTPASIPTVPADAVLAVARQLLDAGADPNDGYLFDALPSPFTVLTGVFGNGELGQQRQPRHPHWQALGRLLLDAGADPNDAQTLYNRMFEPDNSHLELLFEYGLGRGDGGPWKRAHRGRSDTPAQMLRDPAALGGRAPSARPGTAAGRARRRLPVAVRSRRPRLEPRRRPDAGRAGPAQRRHRRSPTTCSPTVPYTPALIRYAT